MKKTIAILTLLGTMALAISSQARADRNVSPRETVTKGDSGPKVVSPYTIDIPIPDWILRIYLKGKITLVGEKQDPAVESLRPMVRPH